MNYNLDLGAWRSVFAVPKLICEPQALDGADALALKALLLLLSDTEYSLGEISRRLACSEKEAAAALDYWVDCGLLSRCGKRLAPPPAVRALPERDDSRPFDTGRVDDPSKAVGPDGSFSGSLAGKSGKILQTPDIIPLLTSAEAAQRLSAAPDLKFLLDQTANRLGRLLSQSEITHIVSIVEYSGLPADVMLMLVEYCVQKDKKTIGYIKKMAMNWGEAGINTHERADAEIMRLFALDEAQDRVRQALKITGRSLSDAEKKYAVSWTAEMGFGTDMVKEAYERCILQTGKCDFRYINKVLANWRALDITTPQSLAESEKKPRRGDKGGKGAAPDADDDFYQNALRKRKL